VLGFQHYFFTEELSYFERELYFGQKGSVVGKLKGERRLTTKDLTRGLQLFKLCAVVFGL